ncbi:nuclear receptor coactivator 3 [Caerostris extrusa]|uniref:Nuclear receptor coactivator 3 n=1 Tax=Caerostris extrusa TaxID=172846 RepID=A0AAV4N253_CAEEX|nr:nuclear receptor coactivator 3 [Caerostris extrusa]
MMSLAPLAGNKKKKKSESKPHSQINKCLNEKRRREQENIHIEELAELVSASPSDMSSLSCKPDKCAILKETVNQIRSQKTSPENELCEELQESEALGGFLFVISSEGKVEFVTENISAFLNYTQEEILEKNIYDFIHPGDRSVFSSNLLLLLPIGNGRDWSSDNSCNKPSKGSRKSFNCRLQVKQESDIKMENKQDQYENMNITAQYSLVPFIGCRVDAEEKRIEINQIEQFSTRIDRDGKVTVIDANSLSSPIQQYFGKDLMGAFIVEFCHPNDVTILKQHLKETIETGSAVCAPYRFRIGPERYARVKTKSKYFPSPDVENIASNHCIIRDNGSSNLNLESQRSISSPSSVASTSSGGPGSVSDSSTSLNGSTVLSPLSLSNPYGNFPNSLNTSNAIEIINDLHGMDIFPDSNWNLEPGSSQSKESDCASVASFVSSPQTAPLSNRSETSIAASPTNSAFVTGLTSNRNGSSVPSPVLQNRAPTPYGGSCYSPSAAQQSTSGRSSPPRALSTKSDSLNSSSTNISGISNISQGIQGDRQQYDMKANQKLRNLLTQSSDISASRQNINRQISRDDMTMFVSHTLENSTRIIPQQSNPGTSNTLLLGLLKEEDGEVPVEPIYKYRETAGPSSLLNSGTCKRSEKTMQQKEGNYMLKTLLNSNDNDKLHHKNEPHHKNDFIQQLLTSNNLSSKISLQNDRLLQSGASNSLVTENSVPKLVSRQANAPFIADMNNVLKRKSEDKSNGEHSSKKLAVVLIMLIWLAKNQMLAEMLAAKAPATTTVPTSIASSLKAQLPQDKLPKHLEKKLVHTPYTAGSLSATTSSLVFTSTAPTVQRDIVTSDARGHVMQQQPSQLSVPTALRTVLNQQQQQQQQQQQLSNKYEDLLFTKTVGSDLVDVQQISEPKPVSVPSSMAAFTQLLTALNTTSTNNNQMAITIADNSVSASLSSLLSDNTLYGTNFFT